jgi:hypothetical protein
MVTTSISDSVQKADQVPYVTAGEAYTLMKV